MCDVGEGVREDVGDGVVGSGEGAQLSKSSTATSDVPDCEIRTVILSEYRAAPTYRRIKRK